MQQLKISTAKMAGGFRTQLSHRGYSSNNKPLTQVVGNIATQSKRHALSHSFMTDWPPLCPLLHSDLNSASLIILHFALQEGQYIEHQLDQLIYGCLFLNYWIYHQLSIRKSWCASLKAAVQNACYIVALSFVCS